MHPTAPKFNFNSTWYNYKVNWELNLQLTETNFNSTWYNYKHQRPPHRLTLYPISIPLGTIIRIIFA